MVHLGIVAVIERLIALRQSKLAALEPRELVSDCRVSDRDRWDVGGNLDNNNNDNNNNNNDNNGYWWDVGGNLNNNNNII